MSVVISVENISKAYRLGMIGGATLREDVARWWAKARGKPDPLSIIGQEHHARRVGEQFWALQNVSFEVKQGEVLGIVGRNGAGKSTLLKILSQVTAPTSGAIRTRGRIASLLEVGTGFHPELSGRENIFLNGAILGMTKNEIRRKLDEIIDFSGIEEFIDTPVKRYSSGMYVRLAFAVAAHLEPEILVLDEVLAVGDAAFQKKCLGKMGEVSRAGRTILFVTHDLEAVRRLCTRAILLEGGEVALAGSTDMIIGKYINSDSSLQSDFEIPPPQDKNAPAFASKLTIENLDGTPINGFRVGAPWQIRVTFTVVRQTEHFIAGMGINSDRGVPLWTVWSEPQDLGPGDYSIVFSNSNVLLCAGTFSIIVGLSSHERTFHYTEDAGHLVLSNVTHEVGALKVNGNCGFIVNPMNIAVHPVSNKDPISLQDKPAIVQPSSK
jgi:lipopolysaccharide transport system ATP-binding protein